MVRGVCAAPAQISARVLDHILALALALVVLAANAHGVCGATAAACALRNRCIDRAAVVVPCARADVSGPENLSIGDPAIDSIVADRRPIAISSSTTRAASIQ